MKKYYVVARHLFSIDLPDSSLIWDRMSNYDPFEVKNPIADSTQSPVFSLKLSEQPIGQDVLESRTVIFSDTAGDKLAPKIDIFLCGDKILFEAAPVHDYPVCVRILCSKDYSDALLYIEDQVRFGRFGLDNAAMIVYAFRTACLDTLAMHASVTVNDGKGYLFLGKSGTGKSTHSSLWLKNISGSWLLNDDNPVVRVLDDGQIRVFGSPWSGKTRCYVNDDVPVGAFVKITQAPYNRIRRYRPLETYTALYSSSSGYKDDERIADGLHETMDKIVVSIPGFELECLPDRDAAILCHDAVVQ